MTHRSSLPQTVQAPSASQSWCGQKQGYKGRPDNTQALASVFALTLITEAA